MSDDETTNLEKRVSKIEYLIYAVGVVALALGMGGASLWNKLENAEQQLQQKAKTAVERQISTGNFGENIKWDGKCFAPKQFVRCQSEDPTHPYGVFSSAKPAFECKSLYAEWKREETFTMLVAQDCE